MSDEQLPLPDFDELPLGALGHRIRSLTEDELRQLLEHERAHAARVPVTELLTGRLDELQRGAVPSPGAEEDPNDVPARTPSSSKVTPEGPAEPGRPSPPGTRGVTGKGIDHSE